MYARTFQVTNKGTKNEDYSLHILRFMLAGRACAGFYGQLWYSVLTYSFCSLCGPCSPWLVGCKQV